LSAIRHSRIVFTREFELHPKGVEQSQLGWANFKPHSGRSGNLQVLANH